MEEENNLIPIGKYKGQPIEVLEQDESYKNWLINQDWFQQRFPNIYNIVVNNITKPIDTPEHNEMQIKFLDPIYRIKLATIFVPDFFTYNNSHFLENIRNLYKSASRRTKEYKFGGSDFDTFKRLLFEMYEKPLFDTMNSKTVVFEESGNDVFFSIRYGYSLYNFRKIWTDIELNFFKGMSFYIELKPSVGDDFPSIFREMKKHKSTVLILKDFTATNITFDQLKSYFKTENFSVIKEEQISEVNLPEYDKRIIFDKKEFDIQNFE